MIYKTINPDEETRDGFLVSTRRKALWNVQFEILQKIVDVCKRNSLTVWAFGGTLLGAVRHHGFIPWDDDVDLLMPRPDYDKLIEIGPNEFNNPFFFQSPYTDKKYNRTFARVRNTETTGIQLSDIYTDINQGIFVDIFPCDAIEDDNEVYSRKSEWKKDLTSYLMYNQVKRPFDFSSLSIFSNRKVKQRIYRGKKIARSIGNDVECFQQIEEKYRRICWGTTKRVGPVTFMEWIFPIELFQGTVFVDFEGISLPAMSGYKEFLHIMYGDYMKPVRGASCHGSLLVDASHSYRHYLPILRKEYSVPQRLKRKLANLLHIHFKKPLGEELMEL